MAVDTFIVFVGVGKLVSNCERATGRALIAPRRDSSEGPRRAETLAGQGFPRVAPTGFEPALPP